MKMPGFTAAESIYATRGYGSRSAAAAPSCVAPQFTYVCNPSCHGWCWERYHDDPDNFDLATCNELCNEMCEIQEP
jgi:hypothetical protein